MNRQRDGAIDAVLIAPLNSAFEEPRLPQRMGQHFVLSAASMEPYSHITPTRSDTLRAGRALGSPSQQVAQAEAL
jgi:hypothetical protein